MRVRVQVHPGLLELAVQRLLRVSLLPTELWVIRVILVTMVEFVFSMPVIVLAMVATQYWPGPLIRG